MFITLLINILRVIICLDAVKASNPVESVYESYLPIDRIKHTFICPQTKKQLSKCPLKISNGFEGKIISPQKVVSFFLTIQEGICQTIKVLKSLMIDVKSKENICETGTNPAIINWMNAVVGKSKLFDLNLLEDLKNYLQKSVLTDYSKLYDILKDEELLLLLETYALLTHEWKIVYDYFAAHKNILVADAHRILIPAIIKSYENFLKFLSDLTEDLKNFSPNTDEYNLFVEKMLFSFECEKKAFLRSIKRTLHNKSDTKSTNQIFGVFSNVYNHSNEYKLKKEIYFKIKQINEENKEKLIGSGRNILTIDDNFIYYNFKNKIYKDFFEIYNDTKTDYMRDFFYTSPEFGAFSLRQIEANPLNAHSNEINFRNFNSEFTSKTVLIFYEIDHKINKKYYWVVSEAMKNTTKKPVFRITEVLFSKLSNLKIYCDYYLSALKYLHSQKLSGVVPLCDDNFIAFDASADGITFDLKYAKVGVEGLLDRIKIDYQAFLYNINKYSQFIDKKESNELKCFLKEISKKAYENAHESNVIVGILNDSSVSEISCWYYSIKSRFYKFLGFI